MLAVKLHQKKKPYLGEGSHFVPVTKWKVSSHQILTWTQLLTGPGYKRRYITLVKIPDSHPVNIGWDFVGFDLPYAMPLKDMPKDLKAEIMAQLMAWYDNTNVELGNDYVGARNTYPQLILGAPLPSKYVKWTKDRLLLSRGDLRKKYSGK